MLEKANLARSGQAVTPLDWSSPGVTIEHIEPESSGNNNEALAAVVNLLGNLALLEKKINHNLADLPFE